MKYSQMKKNRTLYKECKISGTDTHDLDVLWPKINVGDRLLLFRDGDRESEVMVAMSNGDDDSFIDTDLILGFVPHSIGEYLSAMMDMGWNNAFECEISRKEGDIPFYGSLYMNIYIVSNPETEEDIVLDSNLRAAYFRDNDRYEYFLKSLLNDGQVEYRWGGYDNINVDDIEEGDKCVFIFRTENRAYIYLMHCVEVEDWDDNNLYPYIFTNVKGPVVVPAGRLEFLEGEGVGYVDEPMGFLSENAANELLPLILDEQEMGVFESNNTQKYDI